MEIGKITSKTGMGPMFGFKEKDSSKFSKIDIKEIGLMEKDKATEHFSILMVVSMKDIGKII
jgi:hypothetical protein